MYLIKKGSKTKYTANTHWNSIRFKTLEQKRQFNV